MTADVCGEYTEKTPAVATALTTRIGYEETSAIAKQAVDENRTIRVVAFETRGSTRYSTCGR